MRFVMPVVALFVLSVPAFAADKSSNSASSSEYQQERAACMQRATEDQKACLREAGAARQAERRGQLAGDDATADQYEKNRLARCAYLPEADRADCVRRMHGEGTVSGSVESGGVYRELRRIVPADESGSTSSGASRGATVNE